MYSPSNTNNSNETSVYNLTNDVKDLLTQLGVGGSNKTSESNGSLLPFLRVNSMHENRDGVPIPAGSFYLADNQPPVYATSVKFRVLSHMFQWLQYSNEENRIVNKTILVSNIGDEARDMNGGIRCGKPRSSVLSTMDQSQKDKYKSISCYRQLRGIVDYEGVRAGETKKVKISNVPCLLSLRGSNFMPYHDEVINAVPTGKSVIFYWNTLTTEKKRQGSVVYYIIHFDCSWDKHIPVDENVHAVMNEFADGIMNENKSIEERHNENIKISRASKSAWKEGTISSVGVDDDDIPF